MTTNYAQRPKATKILHVKVTQLIQVIVQFSREDITPYCRALSWSPILSLAFSADNNFLKYKIHTSRKKRYLKLVTPIWQTDCVVAWLARYGLSKLFFTSPDITGSWKWSHFFFLSQITPYRYIWLLLSDASRNATVDAGQYEQLKTFRAWS